MFRCLLTSVSQAFLKSRHLMCTPLRLPSPLCTPSPSSLPGLKPSPPTPPMGALSPMAGKGLLREMPRWSLGLQDGFLGVRTCEENWRKWYQAQGSPTVMAPQRCRQRDRELCSEHCPSVGIRTLHPDLTQVPAVPGRARPWGWRLSATQQTLREPTAGDCLPTPLRTAGQQAHPRRRCHNLTRCPGRVSPCHHMSDCWGSLFRRDGESGAI